MGVSSRKRHAMKNSLLAFIFCYICATTFAQGPALHIEKDTTKFTQWVERKIDSVMQKNDIPAVSVGIVYEGKVLLAKGFGVHQRGGLARADENSIYQIASDTKKMTGIMAQHLVLEGKLDLDLPIINFLGETLQKAARERLKQITTRQLLQHTSGLPYRELTMKRKDGEPMLVPYTEKDVMNDLNVVTLKAVPGENFGYSNFGYAVAGYLLEKVSGRSYSDLIREYIARPYDMPNTTTSLTAAQQQRLVTPYRKEDRTVATKAFIMGKLSAAGGVYSNIKDLAQLMLLQLAAYRTYSADTPLNSLVLHTNPLERKNGYGFGLGKKVFATGTQFGHGGDMDGYASGYVFSPEHQAGVLLLTSSGGRWVGELEKELFYKLTNRNYTPLKKSQ